MAPKKDVCELLIEDPENFARVTDKTSKKKTIFLIGLAVLGFAMAVYGVTSRSLMVAPT